jgi:hypothetical protein
MDEWKRRTSVDEDVVGPSRQIGGDHLKKNNNGMAEEVDRMSSSG